MTKPLLILLLLFSTLCYSQKQNTTTPIDAKETSLAKEVNFGGSVKAKKKDTPKDSLKLINHKEATLIDSLWLNALYQSPLYDSIQYVLPESQIQEHVEVDIDLPTEVLKSVWLI